MVCREAEKLIRLPLTDTVPTIVNSHGQSRVDKPLPWRCKGDTLRNLQSGISPFGQGMNRFSNRLYGRGSIAFPMEFKVFSPSFWIFGVIGAGCPVRIYGGLRPIEYNCTIASKGWIRSQWSREWRGSCEQASPLARSWPVTLIYLRIPTTLTLTLRFRKTRMQSSVRVFAREMHNSSRPPAPAPAPAPMDMFLLGLLKA